MQLWLESFAASLGEGATAMLVLDRAGWHKAKELKWPKNVVPHYLPPYSPELNPMENLWAWLKQAFLSNKVFADYKALLQAGTDAWRNATPERIRKICHKSWIQTVIL